MRVRGPKGSRTWQSDPITARDGCMRIVGHDLLPLLKPLCPVRAWLNAASTITHLTVALAAIVKDLIGDASSSSMRPPEPSTGASPVEALEHN
jgi:hypothetical protein